MVRKPRRLEALRYSRLKICATSFYWLTRSPSTLQALGHPQNVPIAFTTILKRIHELAEVTEQENWQ